MAIGSVGSSAFSVPTSTVQAAKARTPRLDNDGDYDNGAPEATRAKAPALPADPNRGRTVNITA